LASGLISANLYMNRNCGLEFEILSEFNCNCTLFCAITRVKIEKRTERRKQRILYLFKGYHKSLIEHAKRVLCKQMFPILMNTF